MANVVYMIDRSFLGKNYRRPIKSTCCICRNEIVKISKIHIKGPKYIYHCQACKKAAKEYAETLKEDYGL